MSKLLNIASTNFFTALICNKEINFMDPLDTLGRDFVDSYEASGLKG